MSKHWKNIIAGNETDEEVEAFLNPPDAHEGTMSERLVGPLGHVMREFAAGNPGTQHLVGELAEAHKRVRVLRAASSWRPWSRARCSPFLWRRSR